MKPFQFISVRLSISLIVGIILARFVNLPLIPVLIFSVLGIVSTGILLLKSGRKSIAFGIVAALTTLCIGMLSFCLSQPKNNPNHYVHQNTKTAVTWKLKIDEVLKSNSFSDRYIAKVETFDNKKASGTILLSLLNDSLTQSLKVDEEFIVFAKPKTINTPLNPHQFNYAAYMSDLGVYHQITISSNNISIVASPTKTLKGVAGNIRENIIQKLEKSNFGEEELSIIKALLLGQRNDINSETLNAYKNAGALHILALSGLHIGILLLLLEFLLKPLERLPKGRHIKLVVIILLLWGFAFIAGMSPSLIRAVCMFTFVAYALYLNRPTSNFNILALSLFFILLLQPQLLFSVGFQMSYAAVFSIVIFYPMLQKLAQSRYWFPNKIWQLLSISIAAQLGVLPLSLYYFHQFPSLFFVSNLAIVPFLGVILGLGILIIVLSLFNVLPNFIANFYNAIIGAMNTVIEWVAAQEAFLFKGISLDRFQLLLGYVILILFFVFLSKKSFKRVAFLLGSIILFQGWSMYKNYTLNQKESLLVFHKSRNTIVAHRAGKEMTILSSPDSYRGINKSAPILTDFTIAESIASETHQPIKNSYRFKENTLTIMDSTAVYPKAKLDVILLTQSPKLNLERLIKETQPKLIIADGSNYKNVVARWEVTCAKRKIPFHYTGEKGFYEFE